MKYFKYTYISDFINLEVSSKSCFVCCWSVHRPINFICKSFLRVVLSVVAQSIVLSPCSKEDITSAAAVTNWLSDGLQSVLPTGVEPNLDKLALAGHSKGGHAAFSLALGHAETKLKFSLLMGIDPVAGPRKCCQIPPKILTYKPSSFELEIPVLVIGTGLGSEQKNILFPACAPDGVNHKEFYNECKPPCYHFVVTNYGHLDMLDDTAPKITKCVCKNGTNCREIMRKTTGGIMTAFLKAYIFARSGRRSQGYSE